MNRPFEPHGNRLRRHSHFALLLTTSLTLLACGSDQTAISERNATADVRSSDADLIAGLEYDPILCLKTMDQVNEMGEMAARNGDFETALQIWQHSAKDGNAFSQASLCFFYVNEVTPEKYRYFKKAFTYCSNLAVDGITPAQYILARMYASGNGVGRSLTDAFYWFTQAAEGGDAQSQYIIGIAYALGEGLPQDLVRAYKWLNLAAGSGHREAIDARDNISSLLTRSELSEGQTLTRQFTPRLSSGGDCSKWLAQRRQSY